MSSYNFNTAPQKTRAASSAEPPFFAPPPSQYRYSDDFSQTGYPQQPIASQPLIRTNTLPVPSTLAWSQTPYTPEPPHPQQDPIWSLRTERAPPQPSPHPHWSQPISYPPPYPPPQAAQPSWPTSQHSVPSNDTLIEQRPNPLPTPSTTARLSYQWSSPTPVTVPILPPTQTSPISPDVQTHNRSEMQIFNRQATSRSSERWSLRGSCACAFVQYELSVDPRELPLQACYCHCATCRNLSGSNYIAFTSMPTDRLRWYSGAWDWKTGRGQEITRRVREVRDKYEYGKSPGFSVTSAGGEGVQQKGKQPGTGAAPWEMDVDQTVAGNMMSGEEAQTFTNTETTDEPAIRLWSSSRKAVRGSCARCGSTLFISYHSNVRTTDIALGTLWSSEEKGQVLVKPIMHIMLREKALWETVPEDGLQRFEGMPGESDLWRKRPDSSTEKKGKRPKRNSEQKLQGLRHLVKCIMIY